MSNKKIWFITGAGRGMGADFARAALRRAVHCGLRRAPWAAGRQSGDSEKLARALITIASEQPPPQRFIAGADAIATAEQQIADLKAEIEANRDLSTSLAFD